MRFAPLVIHLPPTVARTLHTAVPRSSVAVPTQVPPTRSFSDLQAPPRSQPKPAPESSADQPVEQLVSTGPDAELGDSRPAAQTRVTVPQRFQPFTAVANAVVKLATQVTANLEQNYRSVYQAGRAVVGAVVEVAETGRGGLDAPAPNYLREAPPYQTLDKLYPQAIHPMSLEKAGTRAPQFHLNPEQFDALSKANPVVGWIAQNARFHATGACYAEAFADVRRMAGMPLEESRRNLGLETIYPVPNDFKQMDSADLAGVVGKAGVAVLTGAGQMVAMDSHQRLVESGNNDLENMMQLGVSHWVEGRVNHSVILIDDKSGLIPKDHVILYDMDPFCNRFADLHPPRTAIPEGHTAQPDPHFVPEGHRHEVLRIVPFEGLKHETAQFGIRPKVMVPRFELGLLRTAALSGEQAEPVRSLGE